MKMKISLQSPDKLRQNKSINKIIVFFLVINKVVTMNLLLCEPRRIYKKLTIECISLQEKSNTTLTIIIYEEKNACNEKVLTIKLIQNCLELSKNNDSFIRHCFFELFYKQTYKGLWLIMRV